MAYLVAHISGFGTVNSVTTTAVDMTGANFLVANVSSYEPNAEPVLSDNLGNTWVPLTAQSISTQGRGRLWYVENAVVGASQTFTVSGTGSAPSVAVIGFSNMQSSGVFDQENGATNPGSVVTIQPGSITPSVNGALVVTGLTFQQQDEFLNILTPMAITAHIILVPGNYVGLGLAYWFQQTAGAINPTWYWSRNTNADPSAVIASFKTGASSGSSQAAYGFA